MSWSGILGTTAAGLGAVAVPVLFAVAAAGQASADPGICVSGPWGYASACINGPDGSTGGRTGTAGGTTVGATVGETVTTKVKTTKSA